MLQFIRLNSGTLQQQNYLNMSVFNRLLICLVLISVNVFSQKEQKPAFQVVPLGIKGGIDEKNLSAYLVAPINTNDFIALDAGTINAGIEKAIENKFLKFQPAKF